MSCVSVNSSLHRYTCEDCSYTIIDYHNLICEIINENRHRFNCVDCEYNLVEDHNFALKSVSATHHIDTCFYCGLTKGSQGAHSWKVSNDPQYVECSFCGHLKLKPTIGGGEIIPVQPFNKEDELEEETE